MPGKGAERTGKRETDTRHFAALLARAIDRGRAPSGLAWTNQRLADKLQMSDRTIRNWRNGSTIPSATDFDALERTLFDHSERHTPQRDELRKAWAGTRLTERPETRMPAIDHAVPRINPISRPRRWL